MKAWLRALRAHFLTAPAAPVLMGTAAAVSTFLLHLTFRRLFALGLYPGSP